MTLNVTIDRFSIRRHSFAYDTQLLQQSSRQIRTWLAIVWNLEKAELIRFGDVRLQAMDITISRILDIDVDPCGLLQLGDCQSV